MRSLKEEHKLSCTAWIHTILASAVALCDNSLVKGLIEILIFSIIQWQVFHIIAVSFVFELLSLFDWHRATLLQCILLK